jgi:hypothetical protein
MGLESVTYISDLVAANPLGTDAKSEGDDHIRRIKAGLLATFPNVTGAVTPTHTELNYVDGVTSQLSGNSQTATLAGKTLTAPVLTGTKETATAIASNSIDLTAGNYFTKTISADITFSISGTPATGTAAAFVLILTNAGAYTITWWSGVKWEGGVAPTLTSSGKDILGFFTIDGGTTWEGLLMARNQA